ncbi:Protein of unknown function (DUF3122) [Nostoc sp. PCC 7524]|uniref:DUF3122 domain-containing protein n=1 Tax=Nostoc sp. (strain ATCC 29411 / PCC 7524) TaxID=28072 RepID=UPI00029ED5AA|nr:DUF3122 domain-containing protein [Nostoc sp. PCC 7524]AFY47601.1 Protein of unknown function (DUF3122) [Nostoc sp. PCC 7524]
MTKIRRKPKQYNRNSKIPHLFSMCLSPTSLKSLFWWLLLLGILTIFMFLGLGSLYTETVIAAVEPQETATAELLYRSQTRLDDQSGKVWQVVLFKQVYPGEGETLNLRLVGFPGSAELIHPQPLKITTATGKVFSAADVFLNEAPAPTIGQYDLKAILPTLPTEPLVLSIPQPGDRSINISVPLRVVQEWQSLGSRE